jgi:hypothetical protein
MIRLSYGPLHYGDGTDDDKTALEFHVGTCSSGFSSIDWNNPSIELINKVFIFFCDYMKHNKIFNRYNFFVELTKAVENGLPKPSVGGCN